MFLSEKTKKYKEKVRKKSAITAISGIFPVFSAGKKLFSKIGLGHVMSIVNTLLCAKSWKKLMMKSRENAKKPVFPAFSSGNEFFPEIGLILGIAVLNLCAKNQKKTNEPISRKAGNRRTDERTNGQRSIRNFMSDGHF